MDELETSIREKVERAERVMQNYPQVECLLQHRFAPGVYMREMMVPAGTVATGAVHKTEHLTIIVGHCWLTTDNGVQEFIGYRSLVSKPGAKKAIFAIQDTVVTTIHPTEETDLDKLCELLTESKASQLLGGDENVQLQNYAAQQLEK